MHFIKNQLEELQNEFPDLAFSKSALWTCELLFKLINTYNKELNPQLAEGNPNCVSILIHDRKSGRRLDLELSYDGSEFSHVFLNIKEGSVRIIPLEKDIAKMTMLLLEMIYD